MTKLRMNYALALAALGQLIIILLLFAKAAYPLWIGKEVRVKTVPVDPRSLFRGNYARLDYEFTRINEIQFRGEKIERGEHVYLALKPGPDGLYVVDYASGSEPDEGVFIKGKAKTGYFPIYVDYGIDAYFAPKEKALKLEKDLRNGGVAVLKVSPSGQAAIEDIVANAKAPVPD